MDQKKYKCQFCNKHFASEDDLASHVRAKHDEKSTGMFKIKKQNIKLINNLIIFSWIFSIIQVAAILILLIFMFLSFKMNHFYPVILFSWGAATVLIFVVAILTYFILILQLGNQHKAQIKDCTIYTALYIFTIVGIFAMGISKGLSLIRGIVPGYAEWSNFEITSQGTHPTTICHDIKKVKGIRPMGLSFLSYGFMGPVGFILLIVLYFVYYLPRLGH